MVEWLEKRGVFYQAGHRRKFLDFYISDYCLDPIYRHLKRSEVEQLKKYQQQLREEEKRKEIEAEWRTIDTFYYADNSVEELQKNKYGETRRIMVVAPHGNICY